MVLLHSGIPLIVIKVELPDPSRGAQLHPKLHTLTLCLMLFLSSASINAPLEFLLFSFRFIIAIYMTVNRALVGFLTY